MMFDFLFRGTATVASPLHVPAEDGEDDAGVAGDGEEGDGAEERESWVGVGGGGEGIYDALFHPPILCDPFRM